MFPIGRPGIAPAGPAGTSPRRCALHLIAAARAILPVTSRADTWLQFGGNLANNAVAAGTAPQSFGVLWATPGAEDNGDFYGHPVGTDLFIGDGWNTSGIRCVNGISGETDWTATTVGDVVASPAIRRRSTGGCTSTPTTAGSIASTTGTMLASDAFPTIGTVDLADLGNNAVRFDRAEMVHDPDAPMTLATWSPTTGALVTAALDWPWLVVSRNDGVLQVLDLADPGNPIVLPEAEPLGAVPVSLDILGGRLAVLAGTGELVLLDLAPDAAPTVRWAAALPLPADRVVQEGDHLRVVGLQLGIATYDATGDQPLQTAILGTIPSRPSTRCTAAARGTACWRLHLTRAAFTTHWAPSACTRNR